MKNFNSIKTFALTMFLTISAGLESQASSSQASNTNVTVAKLNASKILSAASWAIEEYNNRPQYFLGFGEDKNPQDELNKINTLNPRLVTVWNSTVLVFGAAADGVGIGTAFAVKKDTNGNVYFLTNFHTIEKFCKVPARVDSDYVRPGDNKYPCSNLYVMHDLAIDTTSQSVVVDGETPWKTEVTSIEYFDKTRDLAAYRVTVPDSSRIETLSFEMNFDINKLLVEDKNVEVSNPKSKVIVEDGVQKRSLADLSIYMAAFTAPDLSSLPSSPINRAPVNEDEKRIRELEAKYNHRKTSQVAADAGWIKKRWFKGQIDGVQAYETNKKMGLILALTHNIEVLPGHTGAAFVLSDGRVVGVNSSIEVKEFYSNQRSFFSENLKLESYKSNFAMPSTFLKGFIEN